MVNTVTKFIGWMISQGGGGILVGCGSDVATRKDVADSYEDGTNPPRSVDTPAGVDTPPVPEPDTAGPDTTEPDTVGPDTLGPDTVGPDTENPDTWLDTLWPDTGVDTFIDAKVPQDDATPDITTEAGSVDVGADISAEATGETTVIEGDAVTPDGLISEDTTGTADTPVALDSEGDAAIYGDANSSDITPILLSGINFCFVSNDCNKEPKLPCIALGGLIMENGDVQAVTDFSVFVDPNADEVLKFWSPTVGKEITFIQADEPTGNTGDWSWFIEGDMVNTTGAMNLIYMPADGIFDLNFFMDDLSSAYKYCKHYYTSCSADECADVLIQ